MKIRTCLLASLIFSGITATRVDASNTLSVCTRTPNGSVNVRTGPGTNYRVASKVYNGEMLHYSYDGINISLDYMPPKDRYGYYWVEVGRDSSASLGHIRADFLGCSRYNLQQSLNKRS